MKRTLWVLGMYAIANGAGAVSIQGATPEPLVTTKTKISAPVQATTTQRDDTSGLRRGTIEAVNVAGGSFQVYGQGVTFDPKQVKVFGRDGKATSVYSLHQGSAVRFTLDPSDKTRRRVAVIYLN